MDSKPTKENSLLVLIISGVGITLLLIHFTLTSLYNFRQVIPEKPKALADKYTSPLFEQSTAFPASAAATYNCELEFRVYDKGSWKDWQDASAARGYSKTSRMERVEQSLIHYLNLQVLDNFYMENNEKKYNVVMRSNAFRNAVYYVLTLNGLYSQTTSADSLQLRLNYRFTPPRESSDEYQRSELEFPSIPLEQ